MNEENWKKFVIAMIVTVLLLIIAGFMFSNNALATDRTCVNIEFLHYGEVISCSEARAYPEDKALQADALKFCGDMK